MVKKTPKKNSRSRQPPASEGAVEPPADQPSSSNPSDARAFITPEERAKKGYTPDNPVRIYADGIFDLFHFGHARALEQAKKLYPHTVLIVGCCNDELTHKYKGKTVMTEDERLESLRHCKWVDEIIPDAPWVISEEFLDGHGIDYVAHDALPYSDASGQANDVYEFVKKAGRFRETQRTEGVSTSDLIQRIIRDYNDYVLRNLSRGYTRKELGVSLIREKQIRVRYNMKQLTDRMRNQRLQMATRVKKTVTDRVRYIMPREMEKSMKEFAANMETLMDKLVKGELGQGMAKEMEKFVTGFIRQFEVNYSKLSATVGRNLRLFPSTSKRVSAGRAKKSAVGAAASSAS